MLSRLADDKKLAHQSRLTFLWSGTEAAAPSILGSNNSALADVKLFLSNSKATSVPCPGSFLNLKLKNLRTHLCVRLHSSNMFYNSGTYPALHLSLLDLIRVSLLRRRSLQFSSDI